MNQNEKFEADLRRVETILDDAKASLLALLPEIESPALREETKIPEADSSVASESKKNAKEPPAGHGHFGWLNFRSQKP